jgi:predicted Holliday junction resolvase-like endonuclease
MRPLSITWQRWVIAVEVLHRMVVPLLVDHQYDPRDVLDDGGPNSFDGSSSFDDAAR